METTNTPLETEWFVSAVFQPKRDDDLKPGAPIPGQRSVWMLNGEVEAGAYEGQRQWWDAVTGRWVPECDLAEARPATSAEYYRLARETMEERLKAAGK